MFIRVIDGAYPLSEAEIRNTQTTSFPALFASDEYSEVFPAPPPTYDATTQSVREIAPKLINGHYDQQYEVVALDAGVIAANQAAEATRITNLEAARIQSLWQAAHDYEYAQVSGSAIGLLAMGVMQSKPKCIAVQGWIKAIWTEYYMRKAGASTDCDFSIAGVCPYSVPELMVELGL